MGLTADCEVRDLNWIFRFKRVARSDFRVRSPERDAQTDQARVTAIATVLEQVDSEVRRERTKLAERLQAATDQAAGLVGTDDFEYLERDEASEQALSEAEIQIGRANARLTQLEAFKQKLDLIADSVNGLTADNPTRLGSGR